MDDTRKKSLFGIAVIIVLLVGVTVGAVLTKNLTESKNTKTSAFQEPSVKAIEIVSPKPGSKVDQTTIFTGMFNTPEKPGNLQAVIKIDENTARPLKISQSIPGKVSLDGIIPAEGLQPGRHNVAVYLYNSSSNQPVLAGSAIFSIQI